MRHRFFFILATLLIIFPACKNSTSPTSSNPAETTGTITGTVSDAGTDSAISGASVSTDPATSTVTTGSQGTYSIANVPPNSYTVTASATGYLSGNASVTVTAGHTATANIALQSAQMDYSGNWSGTTSQSRRISFAVDGNNLKNLSFSFTIGNASPWYVLAFGPYTISNRAFQVSATIYSGSSSVKYVLKGTFTSATAVAGTLDLTKGSNTTKLTWSAKKE
jgi:hypothetical protein